MAVFSAPGCSIDELAGRAQSKGEREGQSGEQKLLCGGGGEAGAGSSCGPYPG